MPSPLHDTINELFRKRPKFAVEVLRDLMGVSVPETGSVEVASNDFNDRPSKDFRPDTVITVGPTRDPLHGIIVEVQQARSESKRRQLPRYAATLWLHLQRPVTVLCVCPDPGVAAYYTGPIKTGLPGYTFQALVLGPDAVPVITDPKEAAAHPELAAMSVMMHGERRRPVVEVFVESLPLMEPEHAASYYEYTYKMASKAVQKILEELVSSTTWPVYSPFAKEHFGRGKEEGREEGRAEGREEGRAEGREEGRAEGREEGRAEEGARILLRVLAARGLEVTENARDRIRTCKDVREIERWADRAVVATSLDEVFD